MTTITTELAQRMREAAEQATKGRWWIDSHGSAMVSFTGDSGMQTVFVTHGDAMGPAIRHENTGNLSHWRNDADATHIATSNPDNVLALLDALAESQAKNALVAGSIESALKLQERAQSAEKRSVELEASHAKLRDAMAAIHNTIKGGGAYTPLSAILNASQRAYEESAKLQPLEARPEQQPVAWTDEDELRDVQKHSCGYMFRADPIGDYADPRRVIKLYREPQPAPAVQPVTVTLP